MKELHIRITDQIGLSGDLFCFWPGFTALELEWRLQEIPDPDKVVLHISSPGGDVEEGLAIYNRLLELRESGVTVSVIVESHCYSIATLIAMAASPGELKARESSLWCVHKPMYPEIYYANADDLRLYANRLDACEGAIAAAYISRTGKPSEDIQAQLRLDTIVSAGQALTDGWIDATLPAMEGVPAPEAKAAALKPVAFVRPKTEQQPQPKNKMTDQKKPSKWDKLVAFIASIGGDEEGSGTTDSTDEGTGAVAASETMEDGTVIYFEGTLAKDTAVFSDEAMTNALADGDYAMTDGRTMVVAGGIVSEIKEAEAANTVDLDAANAEIERLKGELEKVTNAKDTTIANLRKDLAVAKKTTPAQTFAADTTTAESGVLSGLAKNLKKAK